MEGPGSVAVDRILRMKKTTTLHEASSLFKTINRSLNIRKRYKQSVIPVAHHPMYDNLLTGEKQNQIAYGDQFKSYFYTEITGKDVFLSKFILCFSETIFSLLYNKFKIWNFGHFR